MQDPKKIARQSCAMDAQMAIFCDFFGSCISTAGPKKVAKNRHLGIHRTTLSGYIFATKARIDNRKKLVKQQYVPQMSSQYGELQPTSG